MITKAADIKLTSCNYGQQLLVFFSEKIEAFVITLSWCNGLGNSIQFFNAIGGIGKGGNKFQIAVIGGFEQAN